ncbi:hypothetical protein SCP_0200950 [Sparassis crispa]|uniref:Uncharacterized protein n=1 Tax=Sparassis crispa TaxID=139825 RepID=A0A401G9Q9_9APHY|nr:hypothetical protein SCP_0200950 [Sparassis crispa]GBE78898.1 hypothetical protein SCP_0200950 [Sparassis crispa]
MRRHFRTHGPDAISPILPPFGSLVVGDHASPFPPFSSPPSTYSGRSDYRPHVYGSDMSYGSDSDCEDGSDQGALSDGDTRQDILEKTNVSFSRIKLGSYSSYSDSRAAPRGH